MKNIINNFNANGLGGFNTRVNSWDKNFDPRLDLLIRNKLSAQVTPLLTLKRHLSVSTGSAFPDKGDVDKSFKTNKQTIYFEYNPIIANLKEILNNDTKTTKEKQLEIEKFMLKTWFDLIDDKKADMQNNKLIPESFKLINDYIHDYIEALTDSLEKLKKRRIKDEKKAIYNFLYELELRDIAATVLNGILPIISRPDGVKYNEFIINLGGAVHRLWLNMKYDQYKKTVLSTYKKNTLKDVKPEYMTFKDFIEDKKIGVDSCGVIGEFLTYNFLNLDGIIEKKLVNIKNTSKTEAVLIPHADSIKVFENAFNVIGFKLPMIYKPVEWSAKQYGGYLLNNDTYNEELIHKNSISGDMTPTNNNIYNQVNYMSSVSYKINRDMYDFILENGVKNKLVIASLHENTEKLKDLLDTEKNDVVSHNSRYYQERNILGLASIYKDVDRFYMPLYFDWRGRIYNDVAYLNYQSITLAKALLMFEEGDELNIEDIALWKKIVNEGKRVDVPKDKFFYWLSVYGANCYGAGQLSFKEEQKHIYKHKTGLDKISFDERVWWIIDHHQQIMSLDVKFWSKASDPLLFIAFCMEYKKIFNGLQTKTYLPVQLDASCNGIQHLSIMSANSNLAKLVNLMPSGYTDNPYDLYSIVLKEINKKITELVRNESKHILLKTLKLDRKLVKRSIMTIPYNVTINGVVNHLEEFFSSEWKDKNLLYTPIDKKHGSEYITQSDMFKLASIIRSTLFEMHPELNTLINYFKDMVGLFNELNIPVVWKTPSGLEIKQKYVKSESARIRSGYYRGASFNILIPTDTISKASQKNGFMPNLIHSMDAATITQLITKMNKEIFHNIYTIHDCFATTACNIPKLNILVRESFISLYADKSFVKSLHKFFLEYIIGNHAVKHIKNVEGKDVSTMLGKGNYLVEDDILEDKFEVIVGNDKTITIPSLPELDEFTNLRNDIRKALYKIG